MDAGETLATLQSITGLEEEAAANLLDAAGGELDVAVGLHFNFEDGSNARPRGGAGLAGPAARPGDYGGDEDDWEGDEDDEMEDDEYDEDDDEGEADGPPPAYNEPPLERGALARSRIGWALGLLSSLPGFSLLRAVAVRIGGLLLRTGIPSFFGSLLLAPLAALGLVSSAAPPTGALAIQRFESGFEERFGTTHPAFFRGTCAQALQDARRNLRFLLVYLPNSWFQVPSAQSDDTAPSASRDRVEAQAAPAHPRAKPEPLGSSPWPQGPA